MPDPLRIATRGSPLALWQAHFIADRLRPLTDRPVEIVEVQTIGDRVRDVPLASIGGEGLFTKEIQRPVLSGDAELAVHSLKDLPTSPSPGLQLAAVPARAPARDAFLSLTHVCFDALPLGARMATSSPRRRAMILRRRPDLTMLDIRGNVDTRLRKLRDEGLDGIVLAQAGLERLGLADRITELLDPEWMVPAVGQGALGVECRDDDTATAELLGRLSDEETYQAVQAERSLMRGLGGGCQVPIGAHAVVTAGKVTLRGIVLRPDGREHVEGAVTGPAADAVTLGRQLADDLLSRGARELLA